MKFEFPLKIKLESVNCNRRISMREKLRCPWVVNIQRYIYRDIFLQFYRAVRDYKTQFGVTVVAEKKRDQQLKSITITFVHLGAFKFHLKQVTSDAISIENLFNKKLQHGCIGRIVVNETKQATLKYNVSTGLLKLSVSYVVFNKYGTVCSA